MPSSALAASNVKSFACCDATTARCCALITSSEEPIPLTVNSSLRSFATLIKSSAVFCAASIAALSIPFLSSVSAVASATSLTASLVPTLTEVLAIAEPPRVKYVVGSRAMSPTKPAVASSQPIPVCGIIIRELKFLSLTCENQSPKDASSPPGTKSFISLTVEMTTRRGMSTTLTTSPRAPNAALPNPPQKPSSSSLGLFASAFA